MTSIESRIAEVVAHAPEWLRRDLTGTDMKARVRAEETLAAMIANALSSGASEGIGRPAWVPPPQPSEAAFVLESVAA